MGREPAMFEPGSSRACLSMTEYYPVRSHVIRLALFTLIRPQLPRPLTFPFPISTKTYYSRDLKGISKSARACKSILAARAHSSILKYLGDIEPRSSPARVQHYARISLDDRSSLHCTCDRLIGCLQTSGFRRSAYLGWRGFHFAYHRCRVSGLP